ncbi:hypothetical protein BJY24_002051 [Nocardia transvalensis]|uniref:Uncharacterized protein n=1 Tax=Nocardia transvalensis TaxID=37333 RepID=A0A7W9PCQ3_9NOCA|nr:hypothetical protein [Nocardia transvalensis]MBB5913184.1 hypothetical protein [Nocardia transvalensis]
MRTHPTAFVWVDPAVSRCPELENARVRRLAHRLGYRLYWPRPSVIPIVDQVRTADVDVVITPSVSHLDILQLHALICIIDVETAFPRMSFARHTIHSREVTQT